jgi:hypothetical protein
VTETSTRLYCRVPVPVPQAVEFVAEVVHSAVRSTVNVVPPTSVTQVLETTLKTSSTLRSRSISCAARFVATARARESRVRTSELAIV